MNALLLGQGGRIVSVINWRNAVVMAHFRDVAFVLDWHDKYVYSQKDKFQMPSVLMLTGKKDKNPNYNVLPLTKINLFNRDDWECQYCGKAVTASGGTIDHVYPLSRGGTHTWRNVVASCKKCNCKKDNMLLKEFEESYGIKLRTKPRTPNRSVLFRSYLKQPQYKAWLQFVRN